MSNVTFGHDWNECCQLFITLNVEDSDQISVFYDALFIKGEKLVKKTLQNGGKPSIFMIFFLSCQINFISWMNFCENFFFNFPHRKKKSLEISEILHDRIFLYLTRISKREKFLVYPQFFHTLSLYTKNMSKQYSGRSFIIPNNLLLIWFDEIILIVSTRIN